MRDVLVVQVPAGRSGARRRAWRPTTRARGRRAHLMALKSFAVTPAASASVKWPLSTMRSNSSPPFMLPSRTAPGWERHSAAAGLVWGGGAHLHHQVHLIGRVDGVEASHDVRVLHRLEDVDLALDDGHLAPCHARAQSLLRQLQAAGMPAAGGAAPLGFLMIFTAATCPVVLFVHSLTFAKCPEPSSFPRSLHTGVVGVMRVFASESLGVNVWLRVGG